MTEFTNHYEGSVEIPETEAETIIRKNAKIKAKQNRSRLKIRQKIEERREAKELGVDVGDLY